MGSQRVILAAVSQRAWIHGFVWYKARSCPALRLTCADMCCACMHQRFTHQSTLATAVPVCVCPCPSFCPQPSTPASTHSSRSLPGSPAGSEQGQEWLWLWCMVIKSSCSPPPARTPQHSALVDVIHPMLFHHSSYLLWVGRLHVPCRMCLLAASQSAGT